MSVKIYVSTTSGNKEIKKHQETIMRILDSKNVPYELVDLSSGSEEDKNFMREHARPREGESVPLPPQLFNSDQYCGNFDDFENAIEDRALEAFLKLEA